MAAEGNGKRARTGAAQRTHGWLLLPAGGLKLGDEGGEAREGRTQIIWEPNTPAP